MDYRPLTARSTLHHANPDGHYHVLATEDDAQLDGPGAAEGHDVHAADVPVHVSLGTQRARDLLVHQQSVGNRAAVLDELSHRSATAAQAGKVNTYGH